MNAQEISIRHSALGWVKTAIDENLSDIQIDLNRYLESYEQGLLDAVKQRLDVVQGVLVMIEQYGSAMLTEEMIALVDFIADENNTKDDQALEVLLRAVLQLPGYLEHIQAGHRDTPMAILPLLNDVRAVRNQDLFSEKLLFLPDLSMHEDGAGIESIDDVSNQVSRVIARKLRPVYQLALVDVIRYRAVDANLQRLEKICEILEDRSQSEQVKRVWWIIGALIESVTRQKLEFGVSIKNLLGKVDAIFRETLDHGERGLLQRQPVDLIKNFLFYIAQPECDGPKAQAVKSAYQLQQFFPSESTPNQTLDSIAGPNQAMLKTVAESTKTEVGTIKSILEVYAGGDLTQVELLRKLPRAMHVISDTLAMIGLGSQRQLIEAQIEALTKILAMGRAVDREQLLLMSTELLQVQQALGQMSERLSTQPENTPSEADESRRRELNPLLSSVVVAALEKIQKTKAAILEFIKAPERTENIDLCITLMLDSREAMQLLEQPSAADLVDGLLMYFRGWRVSKFMESEQLDSLSQIVVSLEYYLETLGEHRGESGNILELADIQLQKLLAELSSHESAGNDRPRASRQGAIDATTVVPETAPVREVDESKPEDSRMQKSVQSMPEVPDDISGASAEAIDRVSTIDLDAGKTVVSSPPAAADIVPIDDGAEILKSRSDSEILEVFLEEAEEEAAHIVRLHEDWMLHPQDRNAVKYIHRAFHTIKGSGRLVGALKISEFASDYEKLLNRVIDKTVPPAKPVIDAVGNAGKALAELVQELKTYEEPGSDIAYLRGLARALAKFKADGVLQDPAQTSAPVASPAGAVTEDIQPKGSGEAGNNGSGKATQAIPTATARVDSQDKIQSPAPGVASAASPAIRNETKAAPAVSSNISDYDETVETAAPPIEPMVDRRQLEAEVRARTAALARARAEASYQRARDYSRPQPATMSSARTPRQSPQKTHQ